MTGYIVLALIYGVIFAFASKHVVVEKGYSEDEANTAFWLGFLLGIIGFIIACVKPPLTSPAMKNQPLSSADELKKWKELYDDGVISKADFEQKKKELL